MVGSEGLRGIDSTQIEEVIERGALQRKQRGTCPDIPPNGDDPCVALQTPVAQSAMSSTGRKPYHR